LYLPEPGETTGGSSVVLSPESEGDEPGHEVSNRIAVISETYRKLLDFLPNIFASSFIFVLKLKLNILISE